MSTSPVNNRPDLKLNPLLSFSKVLERSQNNNGEYRPANADEKIPQSLNEQAIGAPGEVGEGLIRFVDADGNKVIVAEQKNPELFKQLSEDYKTLSGINASEKNGYRRAGAGEGVPQKYTDITVVGPVDEVGPGVIRYQTKDGEKVVVAKRDNPELFDFIKAAGEQISGQNKSIDDGYRAAGDNETWPPYSGTEIGAPDEMGPDLIRYKDADGNKVVVARDDNPKLFEYLAGMYAVMTDPGKKSAVEGAINGGAVFEGANAPLPGLNDITDFSWQVGEEGSVLTYKTQDGTSHVVSKDVAPELFDQVATLHETWDKIHSSEADGYTLAGPNDFLKNQGMTFGSPDELGDGLIRYENEDGKFIVSKDISPQLYDDVVAKWTASTDSSVDSTRAGHNLPSQDEVDVLNLKTGQHVDKDDPNSEELTVSELATQNLIEEYRAGVEDGSIAKDDPRAQLVRALEAQAAYANGRGITGYTEAQGVFGGTWREFDDGQTQLTGADMHDIIDGPKLQETLGKLFADPTIAKDYKAKMDGAIDTLPNEDEIKQKLLDMVGEHRDEYVAYLKDLKDQGKLTEAQQDLSDTLTSLSMFDPDAATKAAQDIQADGLTSDLNDLVADPSKVSDENKVEATKDLFGLLKSVIKGEMLDMPRRTQETIEKFLEEGLNGKQKASGVSKALEELGQVYKNQGSIKQSDIDKALSKSYIPIADRGAIGEAFSALNSKGILGSLGGGVSLFSGIYQLVGKGGALGETPQQRLAIAKDFISFAGASNHFVKAGDAVAGLVGKGGVGNLLGLDKSLPEIWGKGGSQGTKVDFKGEVPEALRTKIETALNDVPSYKMDFNTLLGDGAGSAEDAAKLGQSIGQRLETTGVSAGKAAKIAGSVIKVLSPAADLVGGFADIVLGAFTLKSGITSNDALTKAQGGIQIAAGAFGASAGVLGGAALIGAGSAAALSGPFFLVAIALTVVAGIIGYFVDHNKKQKATEKENDWYRDLAADGLLQDNWADKVEYAHYSINHYGGREAPADDSLFRFQQAEWEHFDATPQEDGSSENRLDESLHKDENGIVGYNTNGLAMDEYGKAFYEKNKDVIDYIHSRWDDWNGKDKIVSDKDLNKIANGDGSQQEKDAAKFLLDNKGFFDMLDVFWKRDGGDGKLSTDDLEAYLKLVGGMGIEEGDSVFYNPAYTDGEKFGA
ncbi:hypothetical protein [Pseudomonas sp. NPDC007930]|uniref:hypothetical protein n=1 Tax=Pseudomonas sp. NPDC007930 TaxID=3364417 RepID=UPI0036EF8703